MQKKIVIDMYISHQTKNLKEEIIINIFRAPNIISRNGLINLLQANILKVIFAMDISAN